MDGLVAAAAVQKVTPVLEYPPKKITEVQDACINVALTLC
jgi:hypothetical protein